MILASSGKRDLSGEAQEKRLRKAGLCCQPAWASLLEDDPEMQILLERMLVSPHRRTDMGNQMEPEKEEKSETQK